MASRREDAPTPSTSARGLASAAGPLRGCRILLTDGDERATLALARSLGRSGATVLVGAERDRPLAGASRWCAKTCVLGSPLENPAMFLDRTAECCQQHGVDVLVPVSDASLGAILPEVGRLHHVSVPFPTYERYAAISDKAAAMRHAAECGLAVPEQFEIPSAGSEVHDLLRTFTYPAVIKPSRSVVRAGTRGFKYGVGYARSAGEATAVIRGYPPQAFPLLVQRRVVGPGTGVFALVWNGEPHALFAHRRIREKPPSGGVSVYRESIALDPAATSAALRLLKRFHWHGVAMVELKVDRASGRSYLMEINGRFWGSLQLAIDAGVDFPALLVRLALGQSVEPVARYRIGVRSRWWWGDVDHALSLLRGSETPAALEPAGVSRLGSLLSVLVPWRPGDRSEVFRLNDPRPFLRESVNWFRTVW